MERKIQIRIGERKVDAILNNSETAGMFYDALPKKIRMQRWGEEYYGDCDLMVERSKDARQDMEVGELAIWTDGSALCIFFGPTPASTGDTPRAVSPVNPIGRIAGDISFLKTLPVSITVEVEKG